LKFVSPEAVGNDFNKINLSGGSFSVCFWIYKRSGAPVILGQGSVSAVNQSLHIGFRNATKLMFAFYAHDSDESGTFAYDNNWVHVSFTYNYSTRSRKIYRRIPRSIAA